MFVFSLAPADSMRESYLQKILRTGMLAAAMIRRALRSLKKGREAGGGRGCSATTLEVHTSGQVRAPNETPHRLISVLAGRRFSSPRMRRLNKLHASMQRPRRRLDHVRRAAHR